MPLALQAPLPRHPAHSGLGARSPRRISAFRASVSAAGGREGSRGAQAGQWALQGGRRLCGLRHRKLAHGMQRASLEPVGEGRAGAQAKQVCSSVAVASEAGGDLRGAIPGLVTAVSRSQAGPILSKVTARLAEPIPTNAHPRGRTVPDGPRATSPWPHPRLETRRPPLPQASQGSPLCASTSSGSRVLAGALPPPPAAGLPGVCVLL